MKLLIVTQVVDETHPVLGFFCKWIEAFASDVDSIEVICLEKGAYTLPSNVTVHSLGKEIKVESRLVYMWRYVFLLWTLRKSYDSVFTHMNPEYTIGGYPVWFLLRKKVGMWYAHGTVSMRLRIATLMSRWVFTSTEGGFRIDTPKRKIVGQGIDVDMFSPGSVSELQTVRLVTVGRIGVIKNIQTLIGACALLKQQGISFVCTIVGAAVTAEEKVYEKKMKQLVESLQLQQQVVFKGAVVYDDLPAILQASDIFIQDGQTGSLDKALLEALSVGLCVISSNEAFARIITDTHLAYTFPKNDSKKLATSIQQVLAMPLEQRVISSKKNRTSISNNHSLATFTGKIVSEYT